MNQNIINKAKQVISNNKKKAEAEYDEKLKILQSDKDFHENDIKLTRLEIEYARLLAYKQKEDGKRQSEIENKIESIKKQQENIKKKYGLQDLKPNYSCLKCQDTGIVDGKYCTCLKKEISKQILAESGFQNLESFEVGKKHCGQLLGVYELMEKWCDSDFKKNLVFLSGAPGVGKTYLQKCMADRLIKRGKVTKIVTAYAMNQDFKEFSRNFSDKLLEKYVGVEVLFIDDLGTEPLYKNVTLENLYLVINERKMRNLPTVISSNLDLDDLTNRYDERITSRIADRETSITLLLSGEDKRLKNNK